MSSTVQILFLLSFQTSLFLLCRLQTSKINFSAIVQKLCKTPNETQSFLLWQELSLIVPNIRVSDNIKILYTVYTDIIAIRMFSPAVYRYSSARFFQQGFNVLKCFFLFLFLFVFFKKVYFGYPTKKYYYLLLITV